MPASRAWLVDASIYIFRAWFSLPDRWHTTDGKPLNAVYGYSSFLLDFLSRADAPQHCAAAFDESLGSCFRNDIYEDYKSSREFPDEALAFQLRACREATERLGIPCFGGERYEADDYLATLARLCREMDIPVTIVTRDKDLGQLLVDAEDRWYDFAGDIVLDAAGFTDKHGVTPGQFADYLALVGDKVDDIPGVPGVGSKTAAALCARFADLQALGAQLDTVGQMQIRGAASVQSKLEAHWPQVLLARKLTGLEQHIPEINKLPHFNLRAENYLALADYLQELGLTGPLVARCRRQAKALKS
jgi:5'-3' exonuclease